MRRKWTLLLLLLAMSLYSEIFVDYGTSKSSIEITCDISNGILQKLNHNGTSWFGKGNITTPIEPINADNLLSISGTAKSILKENKIENIQIHIAPKDGPLAFDELIEENLSAKFGEGSNVTGKIKIKIIDNTIEISDIINIKQILKILSDLEKEILKKCLATPRLVVGSGGSEKVIPLDLESLDKIEFEGSSADMKLVSDYYIHPVKAIGGEITIKSIILQINSEGSKKIPLQLFIGDGDGNKKLIYDKEVDADTSIEIPDLGYHELSYAVKDNAGNYQTGIADKTDQGYTITVESGASEFKVDVPENYQTGEYSLAFATKKEKAERQLSIKKGKDKLNIPYRKANLCDVCIQKNNANWRKVVTFDEKGNMKINDETSLIIVDLNYTNKVANEKAKAPFIDFVNSIVRTFEDENVLLYKYLSVYPVQNAMFNNYEINSFQIDPSFTNTVGFETDVIVPNPQNNGSTAPPNSYKKYAEHIKAKNLVFSSAEINNNFYAFESFYETPISRVKRTNKQEAVNYREYQQRIDQLVTSLRQKGYDINDIYYVSYYPIELVTFTNAVKGISFTADKDDAIRKLNGGIK